MAVFGFNSMKEKIEVLAREQTYTRDEICTNPTGSPIILFNGQIEIYIYKHVNLGEMPANGHLDTDFTIPNSLQSEIDPKNYCTVFMNPISASNLPRDITMINRGFAISGSGNTFNVLTFSGYNHTSQAADLIADILIIKQVP